MALTTTGMGVSQKDNLIEAAREAALKAKEELDGKTPKLLMFFCIYTYPKEQYEEAQKEIYQVFENDKIPLVGGTVIGFFAKDKYYFDVGIMGDAAGTVLKKIGKFIRPLNVNGCSVIALESDYLSVGTGIGEKFEIDTKKAGSDSIKMALNNLEYNPSVANLAIRGSANFKPVDGFVISPGPTDNAIFVDQDIVEGIVSATQERVRFAGGGLCRALEPSTGVPLPGFSFYNGKVYENTVISVVFGSELKIGYGTATGLEKVGPMAVITKAEGNYVIKELNDRPAAEVAKEMFDQYTEVKGEDFIKNPVISPTKGYAFGTPERREEFYWPVIIGSTNQKNQSMTSSIPIYEGMGLSLTKITKDSCKKAAGDASNEMVKDINTNDFGFVMFFSCVFRGQILALEYSKEIGIVKDSLLDKKTPSFGLVSMGEQAFYRNSQMKGTQLTITMMGISNKKITEE